MKVKLVFPILLSLILLSCKEEKKIEIIPNLEAEYFAENEVDKPAEFISDNDSENKSKSDLIDAIKSIHDSKSKDSLRYIIKLRLYISEDGVIEKVKDISSLFDRTEYSTDGVKNYTDRDRLNQALLRELIDVKFHAAVKDGRKVKSWTDVKGINVLATPDGKFEVEMPDFLTGIFGSSEKYFLAVDEMPEPIGGIQAIQKNIKYPEIARRAGIQGKVFVQAFIDENGNVVHTKIIKGLGAGIDEMAAAVVKNAKFVPGRQDGKPVKVQVVVPIVFTLQ